MSFGFNVETAQNTKELKVTSNTHLNGVNKKNDQKQKEGNSKMNKKDELNKAALSAIVISW